MRAVLRQVRDVWQRPAVLVLVLAVLAGCFALASAADARADLAGRDRALATMVRNLGGSGQNIAVSTRWDCLSAMAARPVRKRLQYTYGWTTWYGLAPSITWPSTARSSP
jgi:hypothetical protein